MTEDRSLELLLDHIRSSRGFDFTGYKRASLQRRFNRRMHDVDVSSYDDYLDYLEVHPDEFEHLFNTILINVTKFFRDSETWGVLREVVIKSIIENKTSDEPIRVWSAGCSSGEEAFSLAILLAEELGLEEVQNRVKIYATDVDEEALAQGRAARFSKESVQDVPEDLRSKYFVEANSHFQFDSGLRRFVIFGRHDLVQDAPISRIDLLACRNTLMYFNAETQSTILNKFHFALDASGYLFLGKSEMLLTRSNLFVPVDLSSRIFLPVGKQSRNGSLAGLLTDPERISGDGLIKEAAFESLPAATLIIDLAGKLIGANRQARQLLNVNHRDIGSLLQDLEVSYRPVELRSMIDAALSEMTPTTAMDVLWESTDGLTHLNVSVTPTHGGASGPLGVVITFEDTTEVRELQADLESSNRRLETAYEELQSTVEELETTNEELQSTNEELETTNEELQSTNEELETMNEELQSTNEELESTNEALRHLTEELHESSELLESILENHPASIAVLDQGLEVKIWNRKSRDLWGLYREEVTGHHFFNLDIGLSMAELHEPIQAVLRSGVPSEPHVVAAVNRRGEEFDCEVIAVPVGKDSIQGVVVFMSDFRGGGQ